MIPAELLGTWNLVSVIARGEEGEEQLPFGERPCGQLLYAPDGHMSLVLMRQGRLRFEGGDPLAGTDEEIRQAFEGFEAYAGTFQVDREDGTLVHYAQVCRFPNWEGGTQFRFFDLTSDELVLTSPPMPLLGKAWELVSTWRRKR